MSSHSCVLFVVFLSMGCGGQVDPGDVSDASGLGDVRAVDPPISEEGGIPTLDTGLVFGGEVSSAEAASGGDALPFDGGWMPPPIPAGDGPQITDLVVCGSEPGVDKVIIDLSEGVGPVSFPSELLHVAIDGTMCPDVFDDRSPDGEYAFGARCGVIDRTKSIVLTVAAGITSLKGVPMTPGSYTFHPTGLPGRECGNEFLP